MRQTHCLQTLLHMTEDYETHDLAYMADGVSVKLVSKVDGQIYEITIKHDRYARGYNGSEEQDPGSFTREEGVRSEAEAAVRPDCSVRP